jgi:2-polyprenyl-3-methyl-5-hydroxy-6-metoxy-1,4-benzoquinol methylase
MDKYEETFETWDKVAYLYQEKFMDLDLYNETYDFICNSILKDNARILDVGCGPGNITKYLLSKRPDFDILGIDISPNMIKLAKKNNPTARFNVLDIRNSNQIQSSFDGIICGFCLPYLSQNDCKNLIISCSNLLNENGLLYISFIEGDPEKSDFKTSSTGNRTYFYFHDLIELKNQLSKSGFTEQFILKTEYKKSENEKELHTILIVKKQSSL